MDKCRIIFIRAERIIYRSRGHGLLATTSPSPSLLSFSLSLCLLPYFLDTDITPVSLQMSLQAAAGKQTSGAPYSQGIHYPSPNLYTNGPAILLCLHFLPARLPRSAPLATELVASEVCHLRRSFKVADSFYVDGPITITTTATFQIEDLGRGAGQKNTLHRKGSLSTLVEKNEFDITTQCRTWCSHVGDGRFKVSTRANLVTPVVTMVITSAVKCFGSFGAERLQCSQSHFALIKKASQ